MIFFSFHRPDFVKDEILLKSMNGEDGVALIYKSVWGRRSIFQ